MQRSFRIIVVITVVVVCLAVAWQFIDYHNDLQVAKQLESLGVKVSWKHFHVYHVSLDHLHSGKELASICTYLERLSRLDALSINYGSLTDAALQHLSKLTMVESLTLFDLPVNCSGIKHLRKMQGLKELTLSKTEVNDDTVGNITLFSHLQWLEIKHSRITSKGIVKLKNLRLSTLVLNGSDIDDRSTPILAQMKTLRDLRLDDTKITDASVEYLVQLKGLRWLWIQGTCITSKGYRTLKEKLPDTTIIPSQYMLHDEPHNRSELKVSAN